MAAANPAPGVRFELADPPRPRPETRTDVAGFVGFAERGALHAPVRVEGWPQYEAAFGGFGGGGYLPHAVHAFFENGGRSAYVVRVAVPPDDSEVAPERRASPARAELVLGDPADPATPRLAVTARSPGRWGNGIAVEVAAAGGSTPASARLTAVVRERASGTIWRLADASLDPADARYLPVVAAATAALPVAVAVVAGPPDAPPPPTGAAPPRAVRTARAQLRGGRDGTAACTLAHLLGSDVEPGARWGLAALREVDDVALVAVPDSAAFPVRPEEPLPPPAHPPCTVLEPPADDDLLRSRLPARDRAWTVEEAAALLGATPGQLREANPGVGASLPPGTLLRVPLLRAARADDPHLDDTSPYWPAGAGADQARAGLERLAGEHGLTLAELLSANPGFRPAVAGDPGWRAPPLPVVVPEPAPETPPRWGWSDTRRCADALIAFCEARRDCVALLDPPAAAGDAPAVERFRAELPDTPAAALYWPWLLAERAPRGSGGRRAETLAVPPSGFVAGLTAAADLAVGPHRSPAGQTASRALAAAAGVDDEVHGRLNAAGVNVFRERPGRGVVLEGARSLARGGPWRWLNVRRVLLAIAEEIEERTAWTVFEPNGPALWADLRDGVRAYLTRRWRRGWLAGESADDAFYVRCDEATNPGEERDAGRVVTLVGLRFPPPVEWIEVRIGRSALGLEIMDVDRAA